MLNKHTNTIHLSHTDLDGEGCIIIAQNYLKNRAVKRISYNSILPTLGEIADEIDGDEVNYQLLITDLKLSDQDFKFLKKISHLFSKIVVIDHHLYEFEIPEIQNAEIIINTDYCATALTYKYFAQQIDLNSFKSFVKLVNTFDLWKNTSADFSEAKTLNRLYWNLGARVFNKRFFFNPNITESLRLKAQEIMDEIKAYFKDCEENGILTYNPIVTVSLCDKHIGELKEFYNSKVLINLRNNYHYSIRLDDELSDEECEKIRNIILESVTDSKCINKGGHLRAFGITMEQMTPDEAKTETEKYVKVIRDYITEKGADNG